GRVDDRVGVEDPGQIRRRGFGEAPANARERYEQDGRVEKRHEDGEAGPAQRPPGSRRQDFLRCFAHHPLLCNEAQAPTPEMAVTPPSIRNAAPTTYAKPANA